VTVVLGVGIGDIAIVGVNDWEETGLVKTIKNNIIRNITD